MDFTYTRTSLDNYTRSCEGGQIFPRVASGVDYSLEAGFGLAFEVIDKVFDSPGEIDIVVVAVVVRNDAARFKGDTLARVYFKGLGESLSEHLHPAFREELLLRVRGVILRHLVTTT